jgi:uncharacterized membrane protein YjjP (DUF1212 family)
LENIMQAFKFNLLSLRARLACAVFALVASLAWMAATVAVFASASGELDPLLAKLQTAPAGSAVAAKASAKPSPS